MFENSTNPLVVISGRVADPGGLFVTKASEIYVVPGDEYGQVEKLDRTTSMYTNVATFCTSCYDIFITANSILYCSVSIKNHVATTVLDEDSNSISIVAGVDFPGKTPTTLRGPHGIFVNDNLDLYIADHDNHRIQLFKSGQSTGSTVAGTIETVTLHYPTAIVLDGDDRLYIVDSGNHRIIRSEPNDSRCLLGCSMSYGFASYELYNPLHMTFDKQGNIFVVDKKNNRIQKFFLLTNTCSKYLWNSDCSYFVKVFLQYQDRFFPFSLCCRFDIYHCNEEYDVKDFGSE